MFNLLQISGLWGSPSVISLSSAQRVVSSLLRATLRSLFSALGTVSVWVQQFIDEESAAPTSQGIVQGITLVGSATIAKAVTNKRPTFPISASGIEVHSQPEPTILALSQPEPTIPGFDPQEPTIPISYDTRDNVHTEAEAATDHDVTDVLRPRGVQQQDDPVV